MSTKNEVTLEEILELVQFKRDADGKLRVITLVCDADLIIGDVGTIKGDVGNVLGNVEGSVEGSVWNNVWGSVWGSVLGGVDGNVGSAIEETSK